MPSGAKKKRNQLAMVAAANKNEEEEEEEESSLQTQEHMDDESNTNTCQKNHSLVSNNDRGRSIEAVQKKEVSEDAIEVVNIEFVKDEESSDYEYFGDEIETDGEVSDDIIGDIDYDDEIDEERRNLPNLGTLIDIPSISSFHSQKSDVNTQDCISKTRASVWNCCGLLDVFKGSR